DDLALLNYAVESDHAPLSIISVRDGQDIIDYLSGQGPFADRRKHPMPDLILLDLKMPRVTGMDVLRWLRRRPDCSRIPSIILSASDQQKDIQEAYQLGASSYFTKPCDLKSLRKLIHLIGEYWLRSQRP